MITAARLGRSDPGAHPVYWRPDGRSGHPLCRRRQNRIPLVFGYTLWYHSIWMERPAPFLSDEAVPGMAELLQSVLSVEGAYEGKPLGVLRIELENKAIAEIYVEANPEKEGTPLYCGGYLTDEEPAGILRGGEREADASDPFFAAHTVRLSDVYPDACKEALQKICYARTRSKRILPWRPNGLKLRKKRARDGSGSAAAALRRLHPA